MSGADPDAGGRTDHDLDASIIAYLVGDIAYDPLAALDRRLRQDPSAARRFAELSTRDVMLAWALRTREGHPAHPSTRVPAVAPRRRAPSWKRWLTAIAAVLAIGLGAAVVLARWSSSTGIPEHGEPPVASSVVAEVVLADAGAEIAVSGHWRAAVVGATLDAGGGCRTTGRARLVMRLADGTTVTARGDAAWTLSADRIRLDRGAIDIARPQRSPTLVAATPAWDVEILASRCSLATGTDGDRVEPDDGEARAVRRADGAGARAGGGEAIVAADDGRPVQRPCRVKDGLLALWLFDGGQGGTVPAVVGGSALDLTLALGDPGHATWLPHGLRVDPAASITSVGELDMSAIAAAHAITIECWGMVDSGDRVGMSLVQTQTSPKAFMAATAASMAPGRLCHLVVEFAIANGRTIVSTWRDGDLVEDAADVGDASTLGRNLVAPARVLLATSNYRASAAAASVEFRLVAIYAGALGLDAIRRNHDAGLPQSAALLSPRAP